MHLYKGRKYMSLYSAIYIHICMCVNLSIEASYFILNFSERVYMDCRKRTRDETRIKS